MGLLPAGSGAVHPPYRFVAIKWQAANGGQVRINRKQSRMGRGRLLRAWLVVSAFSAVAAGEREAHAQANLYRPGGDYQSSPVNPGDPAVCALMCERDQRCR